MPRATAWLLLLLASCSASRDGAPAPADAARAAVAIADAATGESGPAEHAANPVVATADAGIVSQGMGTALVCEDGRRPEILPLVRDVVAKGIDPVIVRRFIRQRMYQIGCCLGPGTKVSSRGRKKIAKFSLAIGRNGAPRAVQLHGLDRPVERCAIQIMKDLRFPALTMARSARASGKLQIEARGD